ncbi:formate dehydrogenase accessory sulfurtransferase FdhD [Nocardioides bruguierae]|uniref:formate dehydrogenase accessory sulfurtransferase FdhD n=1 Tax=Nocardioides bruguierae TaxID=2945102 RepID=UPI002021316B|nr:formate dehydrogenase accessory sulfurtransferase FdhD [Nocardioides bruguierae]MCL8025944.1 formate dehydrogenase accessory sulfurtransferase FdhD [Nocardioides bruguierae]
MSDADLPHDLRASLPRPPGPTTRRRVAEHRVGEDGAEQVRRHEDRLVTEEPLELRGTWPGQPGRRLWVTMRTPGHDFELAAGWARHEGLFDDRDVAEGALAAVAYCTDVDLEPEEAFNVVTLRLARAPRSEPSTRHDALSAGSSACGVCGADSVADALSGVTGAGWDGERPGATVVRGLPDRLREAQQVFARTGASHAAGLATADGELLVVREDVGRHNALDKVTGARVLAGEPAAGACLVVSGRIGFELVQKAVAAGVGALVAVGAPTSLSVRLAAEHGLDLWGFTGPRRAVRYA